MKEQEAKWLLSNLRIKKPLKTSIVKCFILRHIKMNELVNKFYLAGDKFLPEMHLKQLGFTNSACGPFMRNKESIEKFIATGNINLIYKNDLDKVCFQHGMTYGNSQD